MNKENVNREVSFQQRQFNVNSERLTAITGDPFADAGGQVIAYLFQQKQFSNATVLDLIKFVADIYVNHWNGNVFGFFLNSPVTQAAYTEYEWNGLRYSNKTVKSLRLNEAQLSNAKREDKKISKTVEYYQSLILETYPHKFGNCWTTGRKTVLFRAGRDNHILAGSSTFVNFHPFLQDGLYVCKEVLLRHFFVPFATQGVGGKDTLIVSNNPAINKHFVLSNCSQNLDAIEKKTSKGPLRSPFSHPSSALFSFINQITTDQLTKPDQVSLSVYQFNNGQTPEISIYDLANNAFNFYVGCINNPVFRDAWLIFQGYHFDRKITQKDRFNKETMRWEKNGEPIPFAEFARWKNLILNSLLHNIPLREYFYTWSENGNYLPLELIKQYQMSLRQMQPESIDLINRLADFIRGHSDELIKKDILLLKKASSNKDLRDFINKIQERAYAESNEQGIITLSDYSNFLMPGNRPWGETRDLLLISIYQKTINL